MRSSSSASFFWPLLPALALPLLFGGCDVINQSGNDENTDLETTNCTIPASRLISGCSGGPDCIPSIDGISPGDDRVKEANNAENLLDEDRVIGLLVGETPLAVPHSILQHHEVVNLDGWDGTPWRSPTAPSPAPVWLSTAER